MLASARVFSSAFCLQLLSFLNSFIAYRDKNYCNIHWWGERKWKWNWMPESIIGIARPGEEESWAKRSGKEPTEASVYAARRPRGERKMWRKISATFCGSHCRTYARTRRLGQTAVAKEICTYSRSWIFLYLPYTKCFSTPKKMTVNLLNIWVQFDIIHCVDNLIKKIEAQMNQTASTSARLRRESEKARRIK